MNACSYGVAALLWQLAGLVVSQNAFAVTYLLVDGKEFKNSFIVLPVKAKSKTSFIDPPVEVRSKTSFFDLSVEL